MSKKQFKHTDHIKQLAVATLALACLAYSATASAAGTLSQTYQANTNDIGQGALLSLTTSGNGVVELANTQNVKNLVGIAATKPLLEISGNKTSPVPVAVSGTTEALVSDLNGTVKAGDKITASPVNGIGMKATSSSEVVGTAQADLGSSATTQQTVTKSNDKTASIKIGLVPVQITVAYYSVQPSGNDQAVTSLLPPFLQTLANAVAGKQVSPLKLILGTVALALGFIAAMVMLYSSIRTNIASIGRNPLAQSALRKGFVDVVIAAIGILIVTIVTTYIILVA